MTIKFSAHDIAANPSLVNLAWKIGKYKMDCLGYTMSEKTVRFADLVPVDGSLEYVIRYVKPDTLLECASDHVNYPDWPTVEIPDFLKLDGWTHKDLYHAQSNPCSYAYINNFEVCVFVGDYDGMRDVIEFYISPVAVRYGHRFTYDSYVYSTLIGSAPDALKNLLSNLDKVNHETIESIARGEYNGIK